LQQFHGSVGWVLVTSYFAFDVILLMQFFPICVPRTYSFRKHCFEESNLNFLFLIRTFLSKYWSISWFIITFVFYCFKIIIRAKTFSLQFVLYLTGLEPKKRKMRLRTQRWLNFNCSLFIFYRLVTTSVRETNGFSSITRATPTSWIWSLSITVN
jgi:hypothetical protein